MKKLTKPRQTTTTDMAIKMVSWITWISVISFVGLLLIIILA